MLESRVVVAAFVAVLTGACGDPDPTPSVTVTGFVSVDLCDRLAGAEVRALGGEPTTSDADGTFEVRAGERTTFEVTAPAHVRTLTTERALAAGQAGVELFAVPEELFDQVALVGRAVPEPAFGHVGLVFVDPHSRPIADVVVGLSPVEEGAAPPAARFAAYATIGGTGTLVPSAVATTTQPYAGLAVWMNVTPGRYRLSAAREGYVLPETELVVEADAVTFDTIVGVGEGGVRPVLVTGVVNHPTAAPAAPLSDVSVTLELEGGTPPLTAITDANGAFAIELPAARVRYDVTFERGPLGPLRTFLRCAAPSPANVVHTRLADHRWDVSRAMESLGSTTFDPASGIIYTDVYTYADGRWIDVDGTQVTLDPPMRPAYYGALGGRQCARTTCSGAADCPAGSRCQAGECVIGDAGPLCQRCAFAQPWCPAGYHAQNYASPTAPPPPNAFNCYCMPHFDCLADNACPEGTFCNYAVAWTGTEAVEVYRVCEPAREPVDATRGLSSLMWAPHFANVPAGSYTIEATAPGKRASRVRARITPGIVVRDMFALE